MNERIREIRKEAGLSQKVFAESLSMSENFIYMVETGKRDISERTRRDICEKYNINETWLLTGEGEMHAPLTRNQEIAQIAVKLKGGELSGLQKELIFEIAGMNADQLRALYSVVEMAARALDKSNDQSDA